MTQTILNINKGVKDIQNKNTVQNSNTAIVLGNCNGKNIITFKLKFDSSRNIISSSDFSNENPQHTQREQWNLTMMTSTRCSLRFGVAASKHDEMKGEQWRLDSDDPR